MQKLISGTLVGGANSRDTHIDSDVKDVLEKLSSINNETTTETDQDKNTNSQKVQILQEITRRLARLEKKQLDKKQYIAYEIIACNFFLGLANNAQNPHTNLGAYLQQSLRGSTTADIEDTVKMLRTRGAREQMLMLLTGPAGSGKSTAVMYARQFCYEFCLAVGVMWSGSTFIYTACTGSAASLFGGFTISNAAFLNQNKLLSLDDKNKWQDVQILIIDEISFMSNSILRTLDRKLKEIETKPLLLGDSQSYFQETSISSNLLVLMKKNSCFQVHQVDTGTTA
jgi:hypothetical protein